MIFLGFLDVLFPSFWYNESSCDNFIVAFSVAFYVKSCNFLVVFFSLLLSKKLKI